MQNQDYNEFDNTSGFDNGERETRTEQTNYRTENGGSGVHYHAHHAGGGQEHTASTRKRSNKPLLAVLAVFLCVALGFGTGMAGSEILGMLRDDPTVESGDLQQGNTVFPIGSGTPLSGDSMTDKTGASDRNPTPEMNKSDSIGEVTYSGSAGTRAYSTLAEAIDRVADTVVEITTETMVNGGWLGNYVSSGAGSGVVISEDGYIVTNHHVIAGADSVSVRMSDGTVYAAAVIGTDSASDIAVLWVDTGDELLQAAELGCSRDLIVGETVFAIGNPLGSLGGTVTDGIISATARRISIAGEQMTLLQTNAAVNPGNSGGGLFNMAGQLVGVVNAKCSEDDVEGLGFAIPVDTAYDVICQLIEYGYVRGVVDSGLTLYDVTASNIMVARRYFNSSNTGVYVWESSYCEALQYGDLILSVNGTAVKSGKEVEALLSVFSVGDTVELTVLRANKETTVQMTLREYVPSDLEVQFPQN